MDKLITSYRLPSLVDLEEAMDPKLKSIAEQMADKYTEAMTRAMITGEITRIIYDGETFGYISELGWTTEPPRLAYPER